MYRIVGSDQKEYGPVTAEQITGWIKEGRSNGQTLARFEDGPWKPLATFPEFAPLLPPPSAAPSPAFSSPGLPAGSAPPTYLIPSVVVTVCCGCAPLGIPAVYHSAQAAAKIEAGDFAGALESSKKARLWAVIALIGGLVFLGLYAAVKSLGYIPKELLQ